jgi:hypothetical protein
MCAVRCVICSPFRRVAVWCVVCECRLAAAIGLARGLNERQLVDNLTLTDRGCGHATK